jgi:hypothetical protein
MRGNAAVAGLGALSMALASCGPHTIHGRVIEGDASFITLVDKDDHRLDAKEGVSDVLLKLQLEPGRINRRQIAQETSDRDGYFRLPVDEFGAGVIELEGGLLARRRGYRSAEGVFPIPGGSQRILVVLAPGRDPPGAFEDEPSVEEQVERFR